MGAPEGTVFLAEEQTAGRGRGAHTWQSPRSTGIYCSSILRPALPPSEVLVLSLAAGLAVRAAIQQVDSRVNADLKWPNDLLIDGKKVCGILTEMNAEATRVRYIVVGIGLNVNQASFPKELSATSLRLVTGSEWSRVELAVGFVKITRSRVSPVAGRPECPRIDSATICRKFFVGSGKERSDRRERLVLRGNDRGSRSARISAGPNNKGNTDGSERNRQRTVKPAVSQSLRG